MSQREPHPTESPVEPLTRREREILALLAEGYSGPEIAQKLTLAVSSVKWHTHQLYGKLGVNSKQRALRRASELGLLDSPGSPAPKPTPAAPKHNLPLQVTRFFGREREIADLKERLGEQRLVTLTGSGGVGKTRLSLRAAEELLADFPDGVWLVELAPLADPALVAQAVAATMGVRDEPGRSIVDSLESHLRDRQVLLVLDNCEHVLEACARLVDRLMRACPRLRLLVSSREPLGVPGEAVFPVPSLPYPEPGQAVPADDLAEFASLRLYLDRARLAQPGYQPSARDTASLAYIVQRLDGIPLAIEMAAARVSVLSAEQLAGRLDDVFRVLTGGSRTALPRQQTLRATLDWSYNLLSDTERLLLRRLAVFAGGCTLEAAEAVCSEEGIDSGEVLGLLAALVSKSLVNTSRQPSGDTRYFLLETVRQYAREKLRDSGNGARLRARLRDYFLALVEPHWKLIVRWGGLTKKVESDIDNLRLALQWSFDEANAPGDVDAGPKLVMVIGGIWPSIQEALEWSTRAVDWCRAHPNVSAELYALLLTHTYGALAMNDPAGGLSWIQKAVEISRGLGPAGKIPLMRSLRHLGLHVADLEQKRLAWTESEALMAELVNQFPPDERLADLVWSSLVTGGLASWQGRLQDAKAHASDALRYFRQARLEFDFADMLGIQSLQAMGDACLALGQYDEARSHYLEYLELADSQPGVSRLVNQASIRHLLALVDFRQGQLDQAQEYLSASVKIARQIPDYNIIAYNLALAAGIAARQGKPARAAKLSGAAQALYEKQRRKLPEEFSLDALLPGWREGPEAAAILQAFDAGQAMTADEAVGYALSTQAD